MVAIIDYDAGNIKSVEKAFEYLGAQTLVTREPSEIYKADRVVLPGVGAFGDEIVGRETARKSYRRAETGPETTSRHQIDIVFAAVVVGAECCAGGHVALSLNVRGNQE